LVYYLLHFTLGWSVQIEFVASCSGYQAEKKSLSIFGDDFCRNTIVQQEL
jgi:hypothetical protein